MQKPASKEQGCNNGKGNEIFPVVPQLERAMEHKDDNSLLTLGFQKINFK